MNKKLRILSGIQPSGMLHIGNYFGAMKQYLELQENNESFIFIANYHAMTSIKEKELLKNYTLEVAFHYLAIGLDPEKTKFIRSIRCTRGMRIKLDFIHSNTNGVTGKMSFIQR